MVAVASAAFEEEVLMNWSKPRDEIHRHLVGIGILAETPDDGNPFGPDPAMLASIGRGDSDTYYAPAPAAAPDDTLPRAPINAAGH